MAFHPGFDPSEAEQMIAICTYLSAYPDVPEITPPPPPVPQDPIPGPPPADWVMDAPHEEPIDHNAYQIGHNAKTNQYVVAFRGTVKKLGSILEDLDTLTVKARGFAIHPDAAIRQGSKLSFESMLEHLKRDLGAKVAALGAGEKMDLFVTGHSQGAAMTILFGAWFANGSWDLAPRIDIKSYFFASAKLGNDYFANDYDLQHANRGFAFRVNNSLDVIPQTPLTVQKRSDLNPRSRAFFRRVKLPGFLRKIMEVKMPCTHNYVAVGSAIVLEGISEPDACPTDPFFQHYAGRYWHLIRERRYLPPSER